MLFLSNSKKYDTLERLLYIYNHSLNNYKKTEEYKRLVALNLPIPDMLSVSSCLKEYKLGLRGIGLVEFVPDTILRLDRYYKYIIYCDLSLLTSDFLSDLSYYHKLVIVSNDFNLHDLSIHFPSVNTYLDSYIDLSKLSSLVIGPVDLEIDNQSENISYNFSTVITAKGEIGVFK